jgi:hypothetical protein
MYPPIVTKDPAAVEAEVQSACREIFPDGDARFVSRAVGWTKECFTGHYKDCQAIDAPYHDLEHTLQGTLCMARLLRGRHRAGVQPQISEHSFQLGIIAILMHDTGYLKKRGDTEGTGAKYTITHVARSKEFAAEILREKGFGAGDIKAVQNMISCTGVDAVLSKIPFQSEVEKIVGHALGTADLLGQMAADDYVDKLPILYSEFAEAARFSKDDKSFVAMYSSAQDLVDKTAGFWEQYARQKLERDFNGLYQFLNDPYPNGSNFYIERIEANMMRVRKLMVRTHKF